MAAIITNKFRINNAEQFVESFSETAAETYYLFIGRAHAWASDVDAQGNTIAEGTDASPPTPNDDVTSEFYNLGRYVRCKTYSINRCIKSQFQEETGQQAQLTICMNTTLVQQTLRRVVLQIFLMVLML